MFTHKYRKRYVLTGILVCLLVVCFIIARNILISCPTNECLVFPGKNLWQIQEIYENDAVAFRGRYKVSDYFVRLEHFKRVPELRLTELTKIRLMQTQGLYDAARSPYPGLITDRIVCESKYKPSPKTLMSASGVDVTYYSAFLNNRFQYGICTDDQIAYKGYVALFACQQTNDWYSIEIILPQDKAVNDSEYVELFRQIGCQTRSLKNLMSLSAQ